MKEKKLYEGSHPYISTGQIQEEFVDWDEFMDEYGDADDDYNLVIRWDWYDLDYMEYAESDRLKFSDMTCLDGILRITMAQQRKGILATQEIHVCKNDEPKIREWLKAKLEYLLQNWVPLRPKAYVKRWGLMG